MKNPSNFIDMFVERTTLQCRVPNRRSFDRRERAEDDGEEPLSVIDVDLFLKSVGVSYLRISTPTYPMDSRSSNTHYNSCL